MATETTRSQFDKALLGLRKLILDRAFEPKSRLAETALSKRLNISRTPLRQAMDRLVEEGLLERNKTGGCRVASFSMEDVFDAIELRGVLEGTAVRIAAERGPVGEILAKCHSVLDLLDRAVSGQPEIDFDAYVDLNAEIHHLMPRLAGSAILTREVERISRLPLASPSAFLQGQEFIPDFQASLWRAQDQHRRIVRAVENREGSRAEALAREHAFLARTNFEHITQNRPALVRQVPGLALVSPPARAS